MLIFESGDLGLNPSGVWFESGDDSYFVKGKNEYLATSYVLVWVATSCGITIKHRKALHTCNDGKKVLF